jgi:hypothetical protein
MCTKLTSQLNVLVLEIDDYKSVFERFHVEDLWRVKDLIESTDFDEPKQGLWAKHDTDLAW